MQDSLQLRPMWFQKSFPPAPEALLYYLNFLAVGRLLEMHMNVVSLE